MAKKVLESAVWCWAGAGREGQETGSARQTLCELQKRNEKTNFSGMVAGCTNGLMQAFVRLSPTDGTRISGDLVF